MTKQKTLLIEQQQFEGIYGFFFTLAIVDHPTHGRMLISEMYAGENTLRGGAYRWEHGLAIKVQPDDTLESLTTYDPAYPGCVDTLDRAQHGYDDSRPVLGWPGYMVARVAQSVGLA